MSFTDSASTILKARYIIGDAAQSPVEISDLNVQGLRMAHQERQPKTVSIHSSGSEIIIAPEEMGNLVLIPDSAELSDFYTIKLPSSTTMNQYWARISHFPVCTDDAIEIKIFNNTPKNALLVLDDPALDTLQPKDDQNRVVVLPNILATIGCSVTAANTLSYISETVSITVASSTTSGVVTTGAQTFAGVKTFNDSPICILTPSSSDNLVNKGYVDMMAMGMTWQSEVISFYDFAAGDPSPLADGDRYIAATTTGIYTATYIYTYHASGWVETVPVEGYSVYVTSDTSPSFANQCCVYNGQNTWVGLGSSIVHQSLIGAGTITHATLDSYLNQAVMTTSTPRFAAITFPSTATKKSLTLYDDGGVHFISIGREAHRFVQHIADESDNFVVMGGTAIDTEQDLFQVSGNKAAGSVAIHHTTASTSATTGALVCLGGAGIVGAANIGGALHITDTTASTSATTGAVTVAGGLGVAEALNAGTRISAANMTCTTAPVADTDVVRKVDVPALTTYTYTLTTGGWSESGIAPVDLCSLKCVRFGDFVTLSIADSQHTLSADRSVSLYDGTSTLHLPAEFIPTTEMWFIVGIRWPTYTDYTTGILNVSGTGEIIVLRNTGGVFTAGTSLQIMGICVTWLVNTPPITIV